MQEFTQDPFWERVEWEFEQLTPLWATGSRLSELSQLFMSIPNTVRPLIRKALDLLTDIENGKHLLLKHAKITISGPLAVTHQATRSWESVFGVFEIFFDPETHRRKDIRVNARMATLLSNSTVDDLLYRLLNDDFDFPIPPMDFVMILSDDIWHEFSNRVRYIRLIKEDNGAHYAELVCVTTERETTDLGQLTMVSLSFSTHKL
jgi:hypothetical protein